MNPTSIRPAQSEDLPEMYSLLAEASRSFANVDVGDLPGLLRESPGTAVQVDTKKISGFVILQQEDWADEQSGNAPARVALRATASKYPGAKARKQFSALFQCAEATLPARPAGQLFFALTDQNWLQASLSEAGFERHDSIRFYERSGPVAQPQHQPAHLLPADRSDLPHIVRVDSAAFEPLWRLGATELARLYQECRIEVAVRNGIKVGYAALNLYTDGDRRDEKAAQLVRLAVHTARAGSRHWQTTVGFQPPPCQRAGHSPRLPQYAGKQSFSRRDSMNPCNSQARSSSSGICQK